MPSIYRVPLRSKVRLLTLISDTLSFFFPNLPHAGMRLYMSQGSYLQVTETDSGQIKEKRNKLINIGFASESPI